jgi:hypothetical protein
LLYTSTAVVVAEAKGPKFNKHKVFHERGAQGNLSRSFGNAGPQALSPKSGIERRCSVASISIATFEMAAVNGVTHAFFHKAKPTSPNPGKRKRTASTEGPDTTGKNIYAEDAPIQQNLQDLLRVMRRQVMRNNNTTCLPSN